MGFIATWKRLGEVGVAPHHGRQVARTIRCSNYVGASFAAFTLPMLVLGSFLLPLYGVVVAISLVAFASTPVLNRWGFHGAARVTPLVTANVLVALSCKMLGADLHGEGALFVTAATPLMLFQRREARALTLLAALSMGLFLAVLLPLDWGLPQAHPSPRVAALVRLVYGCCAFGGLSVVLGVFFWHLTGQEEQLALSVDALQTEVGERRRIEAQLVLAKDAAEAGARAKSEFLATMSHELRTPMNAVLGAASLLRESALEQEQHDMLQTIETAGQSLLTLLGDVLDLSVADLGGLELHGQVFRPHDLVEGTVLALSPLAEKKGLDLALETKPGLPAEAVGDVTRIRQTLSKLLGNALKFTAQGFVRVVLEGVPHGPHEIGLKVSIMDSGVGIAEHQKAGVFELFSQSDSSTTRAFGGAGLGLALSQRLVKRMGGSIGFQSLEGSGSTFWFEVPVTARFGPAEAPSLRGQKIHVLSRGRALAPALVTAFQLAQATLVDEVVAGAQVYVDPRGQTREALASLYLKCREQQARLVVLGQRDEDIPPEATVLPRLSRRARLWEVALKLTRLAPSQRVPRTARHLLPLPAIQGQPPRVLVVEDNPVNQMIVKSALAKMGVECAVAGNGRLALEELAQARFDLVLMDIQMPVMDGYEATRAIRARENGGPRLPVVALTANVTLEDRESAFAAGMDAFLSKPVRIEELRATVASLTERQRADETSRAPRLI